MYNTQRIINKIYVLRDKTKSARPIYSKKEWFLKMFLLGLGSVTYDFLGRKINDIELNLYYGKIINYGFDYVFYLGSQGLLLGILTWRLFEVYWWAKNTVHDDKNI